MQACVICQRVAELNAVGLCIACAVEAETNEGVQSMTIAELLEAIQSARDPDEIMDLFMRCQPPSDRLEQARLRERLLRALQGKSLSSPAKLVDAWLGSAQLRENLNETQASMLVNLVLEREGILFHTPDQQAFAAIVVDGHREVLPIRSRSFRLWLARCFYAATGEGEARTEPERAQPIGGQELLDEILAMVVVSSQPRVPGAQALSDAIATLEGMALFEGSERHVYVRVAHVEDLVYLDLVNEAWQAVEISRSGWRVVDMPPVMFRRPAGLGELPIPQPGGSVAELRPFVNVRDAEWPLVKGGLLGLLSPGPYPVIVLLGEQGSAKSTSARVIRAIVDPNTAPLRRKPRSDHDLAIAANNAWVISYDNLSSLPVWLSDAICTLATGGGFATRMLYSDSDEVLFDSTRPVVINGIGMVVTRSDLLDRALLLTLPVIEEKTPESDFWPAFHSALPRILGSLLDAVAEALGRLETVRLSETPRMVDFARWVEAGSPALGLEPGEFLDAYLTNRRDADLTAIESSPVGKLVIEFVTARESWTGSATELLRALEDAADAAEDRAPARIRTSEGWPKQPNNLSHELRHLAPNLRRVGVEVELDRREGKKRNRLIKLWLLKSTPADEMAEGSENTVRTVRTVRDEPDEVADAAGAADDEMQSTGQSAWSGNGKASPELMSQVMGLLAEHGALSVPALATLIGGHVAIASIADALRALSDDFSVLSHEEDGVEIWETFL